MPQIEQTIEFTAPPEQVWAVVSDPSRFAEWLTMHKSWQGEVPTDFVKGTQVTAVVGLLNMPTTIVWTVEEYAPPHRVRLSGAGPAGVQVSIDLGVAPQPAGSAMTIRAEFEGALVAGPIGPMIENAGRQELDASLAKLAVLVA